MLRPADVLACRTLLCADQRFRAHQTGAGHPECPARLSAIEKMLGRCSWASELKRTAPQPAQLEWVEELHSYDYIRRAKKACGLGETFLDTRDVSIGSESFDVALLAVGAGLAIADEVMSGAFDNAFAMIRPPGHHAERNQALGFCLFNNVGIVARYLQKFHHLDKIAILDWDVHHGNGTQHAFEEDPSVFYISTHQYPYYPGTGHHSETGFGRGAGATLNCPLAAGSGDLDYERVFVEKVLPALNRFKPEAIIVSAGFDAHQDDPLADMMVTTACFRWMTSRVMECADRHSSGRILSLLEGGYNLEKLAECVVAHLAVLSGQIEA